jgi:hypothetical protein
MATATSGRVSVDVRSRTGADVRAVEPRAFFDGELPDLISARGGLVAEGARQLAPRPMAFEVSGPVGATGSGDRAAGGGPGKVDGGGIWTLAFDGHAVTVAAGPTAAEVAPARVRLDAEALEDLVNDLRTPMGLFTGGDLDQPAGRLEDFLDWWVILRGLLDDQAVHTRGAVTFTDRDGAPLDLHRAFRRDDDPDEMSHFLAEAGYLHLTGVFDPAEMAAVSDEMDAAATGYAPGDGHSWWARTGDGTNRLVRMQEFHTRSATTRALMADDRLVGLTELTTDGHRLGKPGSNANLVEALIKPIGVVEGISDVPWHKDCSLGSHSYRCCSMTVGISVTGAGAGSGQLGVVAGSHRALIQPAFVRRDLDLPQVELPTDTGDVTIHLSCTLHMSHPPVTRERRVLYTDLSLPHDGPRSPGEAKLARIREAAPVTVSQVPTA